MRRSPLSFLFLLTLLRSLTRTRALPEVPVKEEQEKPNKKPSAVLELGGAFSLTSEPLPVAGTPTSRETFLQIFRSDRIRDLLISGGGNQQLHVEDMTPEYHQLWKDKCDMIPDAHSPPDDGQSSNRDKGALLVTGLEVKFPGLRIVTTSLTGVQLIVEEEEKSSSSSGLGRYEYCLLAQNQVPHGSNLAVKIFNQVSGNVNRTKDDNSLHPVAGASLSKVSLVESPDKDALAIHFDCWVRLEYSFPSFLLRVLPLSKRRVEKILSGGLVRAAKKEVTKGVKAAREAMLMASDDELVPPPKETLSEL